MIVWQHVKNSWIFPFYFIPEARLRSNFFKTRASGFVRVSKHSKTIKNTRPAASCFHQFSCVWKPRWNPRTRNVNLKEEGNAHQLIPPFKPLSTRWEWLLNLCLEANLDKRNVNTDIRKGSKFLNSNPHLTAKGQTLDFYIKMDTISMITNNFAKIPFTIPQQNASNLLLVTFPNSLYFPPHWNEIESWMSRAKALNAGGVICI